MIMAQDNLINIVYNKIYNNNNFTYSHGFDIDKGSYFTLSVKKFTTDRTPSDNIEEMIANFAVSYGTEINLYEKG